MEPISALAIVISNVASFFGQQRQAAAAEREGKLLAADAIDRGEFDYARYSEQLARLQGSQTVSTAAQGIDMTQGSAATIASQTEAAGQADLAMIRENALREAYALRRGYKNQAATLRAQSYGALGEAFGTIGPFAANAWDVYRKGKAERQVSNWIGRQGGLRF